MKAEKMSLDATEFVDNNSEGKFGQSLSEKPPREGNKRTIGGILLIIAGVLGFLTWISVLTLDISLIDTSLIEQEGFNITPEQLRSFFLICGSIGFVMSIFPILGGIAALKRKMRWLSLIGGLLGLFIIGPLFASSILSLLGLILVGISKEEFQ